MTSLQEQREQADRVREFILKLAVDSQRDRQGSIDAIVSQFQCIEYNNYFPDVFSSLDPDIPRSDVKLLGKYEQGVLRQAMNSYIQIHQ